MTYFTDSTEALRALYDCPQNFSMGDYLTSFNLANVNMPCYINKEQSRKPYKSHEYLDHAVTLSRSGDIVTKIEINGYNISHIQIQVGGNIVWEYIIDYNHVKQVIIEPLISGILMILLSYHDVKIFIKADMLFSVNAYYMFLTSPIRMELVKLMQNGIKIKYNSPNEIVDDEVKLYSEFIFITGMGVKQYVKITSEAEIADAHERYRGTILKQLQNTFTAFAHRKYAIIAVAEHIFCDCCI